MPFSLFRYPCRVTYTYHCCSARLFPTTCVIPACHRRAILHLFLLHPYLRFGCYCYMLHLFDCVGVLIWYHCGIGSLHTVITGLPGFLILPLPCYRILLVVVVVLCSVGPHSAVCSPYPTIFYPHTTTAPVVGHCRLRPHLPHTQCYCSPIQTTLQATCHYPSSLFIAFYPAYMRLQPLTHYLHLDCHYFPIVTIPACLSPLYLPCLPRFPPAGTVHYLPVHLPACF